MPLTLSYVSLHESEDLPSRIRVFVSASNNKFLAEGLQRVPVHRDQGDSDDPGVTSPDWVVFSVYGKHDWTDTRGHCDLANEPVGLKLFTKQANRWAQKQNSDPSYKICINIFNLQFRN